MKRATSRKQAPTQSILNEYQRLNETMLQSVYCVDFPFGVVGPTRRRMDEIERQYDIKVNA